MSLLSWICMCVWVSVFIFLDTFTLSVHPSLSPSLPESCNHGVFCDDLKHVYLSILLSCCCFSCCANVPTKTHLSCGEKLSTLSSRQFCEWVRREGEREREMIKIWICECIQRRENKCEKIMLHSCGISR
jgi:hypothetical protein